MSLGSRKFCPGFKRVITHSGSFCRKISVQSTDGGNPEKWKALRFLAVFLLNTLLSFSLTPEEKEHILEEEYGISMEMKIRKELEAMCNLSEAIEERGVERGMRQGLERGSFIAFSSLVRDGLLRTDEAARRMKMSEEDFVARMREERENEKTI